MPPDNDIHIRKVNIENRNRNMLVRLVFNCVRCFPYGVFAYLRWTNAQHRSKHYSFLQWYDNV